jgi:hypothetical protein
LEKNTASIFRIDYSLSPDNRGYVPLKYQKKMKEGREKRNRCRRRRKRVGRGKVEGLRGIKLKEEKVGEKRNNKKN